MSQWMTRAVRNAGLEGAEKLHLPPGIGISEIWERTASACGLPPEDLAAAIADTFSMKVAEVEQAVPTAVKLLPASVARKYGVYPLCDLDRYLLLATSNPVDTDADQEISFASGRLARFQLAPPTVIDALISQAYDEDTTGESMMRQLDHRFKQHAEVQIDISDDDEPEQMSEAEVAAGPIVKLANIILHEAVERNASDVHIQPLAGQGVVRFRVDGVLHNGMHIPLPVMTRVVSRIKIMAKLDITDRLRPQDGRARITVDGLKYDLRVSTVPTRKAEKAVIRLLDTEGVGTMEEMGIVESQLERIRHALRHRDGIVVVTGPTGSGKTTTMYGALQEIATEDVNIMTVEDPVEYELPRLTQIQVEHKQGMTFASALRAILRQDPDVIFVGEIRDAETAAIAAQASLTGHLVLATLHTNDAVGAFRRFTDLGLDTPTLAEAMRGALAQRLVRKLCTDCSEEVGDDLTASEAALSARYGERPLRRAIGCPACMGSGYRGRLPLTEFLTMTPTMSGMLLADASPQDMQAQAIRDGMTPLLKAGLDRVLAGETTLEEVERVVGASDVAHDRAASFPEGDLEMGGSAAAGAAGVSGSSGTNGSGGAYGPAPGYEVPGPAGSAFPVAPGTTLGGGLSHVPGPYSPVVAEATRAVGAEGSAPAADRSGPGVDGTHHVLIVDDDGTTRSIAKALIEEHLGYTVSECADGAEALLRFAKGEQCSLMVLDLDMPVLGGREVLRAVRQSVPTAKLPVVVLTGSPDPETEIELMEMGADDYLRKPLDPARLEARIKAAIRRAQG